MTIAIVHVMGQLGIIRIRRIDPRPLRLKPHSAAGFGLNVDVRLFCPSGSSDKCHMGPEIAITARRPPVRFDKKSGSEVQTLPNPCFLLVAPSPVPPMPRAYSLMVGLTEVDESGPYYSRHFPGFNSRNGCEGCRKDVERMEGLAHYLGYENIVGHPLLNERATTSAVINALEMVAAPSSPIQNGDIFLLYMSSHGVRIGDGEARIQDSLVGNSINIFLLHNRPLVNFDLLTCLIALQRRGVRVVTIIDACHAGLGTNLASVAGEARYAEQRRHLSAVAATSFQVAFERLRPGSPLPTSLPLSVDRLLDLNKQLTQSLSSRAVTSGARGSHPMILAAGISHLGAVRDELTAMGGVNGSLFTRKLFTLFCQGGDQLTISQFRDELAARMPLRFQPVVENWPVNRSTDSSYRNYFYSTRHFLEI